MSSSPFHVFVLVFNHGIAFVSRLKPVYFSEKQQLFYKCLKTNGLREKISGVRVEFISFFMVRPQRPAATAVQITSDPQASCRKCSDPGARLNSTRYSILKYITEARECPAQVFFLSGPGGQWAMGSLERNRRRAFYRRWGIC